MIIDASPVLNLLFAKGLGTKTLSRIVDYLVDHDISPGELLDHSDKDLVDHLNVRPKIVDAIRDAVSQAVEVAEELDREGIEILIRGFDPYPEHLVEILGDTAPPVLFAHGNKSILTKRGVGFCGSRKASEKGIRITGLAAEQLAERDINVVSGYAKGVDLAAHVGAMQSRGVTTIVLAEGILRFRAKREVKSLFGDENYLFVSEFSPRLPWSGRNAMQRNRMIIGWSNAVVCIESGMTGGTFAAAETTLKLGLPLFVADYAQPSESASGNKHFLGLGAFPLRGDRTGKPNLSKIFESIGLDEKQDEVESMNEADEIGETKTKQDDNQETTNTVKEDSPTYHSVRYPKRLIEVDLPISRISAHSRREKSIRHGHISTLHIWWARRPLAACRAVICASLWPDPADELCPQAFRDAAVEQITAFANRVFPKRLTAEGKLLSSEKHLSMESRGRWEAIATATLTLDANETADMAILRMCLLDFIADFANWDNSTVPAYLETSRALTQAAHEALGGVKGTRPLVVDPFAGGGSIPLESLRVGADAFASDLNPIPILLNKVMLEFVPKFGQRLADEVRKWGEWIGEQAKVELADLYPQDSDGNTPLAYLWARTIKCEGPGCGVEVPLIRSMILAKTNRRSVALTLKTQDGKIDFELIGNPKKNEIGDGTIRRGTVECPCCHYVTPLSAVKKQLKAQKGGAHSSRLFCVVTRRPDSNDQIYRLPQDCDFSGVARANDRLKEFECVEIDGVSLIPNESTEHYHTFVNRGPIYGMTSWDRYFTPRQLASHCTLVTLIRRAGTLITEESDQELGDAVTTCLAMALGKCLDYTNAVCSWMPRGTVGHLFARQAIPMTWDFPEANPISDFHCAWKNVYEWSAELCEAEDDALVHRGHVEQASASAHVLPNDSCAALITDPPYYYSVQYADLSDFFYVWLRRVLKERYPSIFSQPLTPKDDEIIVQSPGHEFANEGKNNAFYESRMRLAMTEGRRILHPSGIGIVVFAHTSTSGWEAQLQAMVDAGWIITGSWPIDTERAARLLALDRSVLASSVHLVCRPRENVDGSLREEIGEWRDVLSELPRRIHEWMPRLAAEGVVGADAIFACLGPALEVFSRYSRVEKASGEAVQLKEYLEQVWAAVSTEALSMIFKDADAAGLEPDARITAMWLWTLGAGNGDSNGGGADDKVVASKGYTIEFDAARKIAQGLGIHLEESESIVEVKGDKARLLPVRERTRHLFGKDDADAKTARGRKTKKEKQRRLFEELDELEAESEISGELKPHAGETVLDRVHQSMILFASGRGDALRRFLVDDGAGNDARFWKLAQSLSALYPKETDEKRWVDGVLARKKGLGL